MSTKPLYCHTCKKYVAMEGRVGDYRCPTCQSPVKIGDGPIPMSHREAKRDEGSFEVSLTESFEALGLSEEGARIAAKGRGGVGVPDDVANDRAKFEASLTESFEALGLSEEGARIAAKGRR